VNDISELLHKYVNTLESNISEFTDKVHTFVKSDVYCDSREYYDLYDDKNDLLQQVEAFEKLSKIVDSDYMQEECEELEEKINNIFKIADEYNESRALEDF
jgi:hypothetical protein